MNLYERERITEINLKGGLLLYKNKIILDYLKKSGELPPKIIFEYGIYDEDGKKFIEEPKTFRMDYIDVKELITELVKAMVRLGKEEGIIHPENWQFRLDEDYKLLMEAYRGK